MRAASTSRCSSLLRLHARPADLEVGVEALRERQLETVEQGQVALPRRRAAERDEPKRAAVTAPVPCREPADVDPMPDRVELRALERIRGAIDAQSGRAQAIGDAQRPVAAPVRVPEEQRHARTRCEQAPRA